MKQYIASIMIAGALLWAIPVYAQSSGLSQEDTEILRQAPAHVQKKYILYKTGTQFYRDDYKTAEDYMKFSLGDSWDPDILAREIHSLDDVKALHARLLLELEPQVKELKRQYTKQILEEQRLGIGTPSVP